MLGDEIYEYFFLTLASLQKSSGMALIEKYKFIKV